MTYDEVIRYYGTQVKLAAAIGIHQSTVSAWNRVVPDAYQYQIEVITNGKLRVDPALRAPNERRRVDRRQESSDSDTDPAPQKAA